MSSDNMNFGTERSQYNFNFPTNEEDFTITTQTPRENPELDLHTIQQSSLDGTDSTSQADTDAFMFFLQQPTNYTASAGTPTLSVPGQQGQSQAFIKGVQQTFVNVATGQLNAVEPPLGNESVQKIIQYLISPSSSSLTEAEQQIADQFGPQITAQVQSETGLPTSWTIQSDQSTWLFIPPNPYNESERQNIVTFYNEEMKTGTSQYIQQALNSNPPELTSQQANELQQSIDSGEPPNDPELLSHYNNIQSSVTEFVQNKYGLEKDWTINTSITDATKWVPVNLSALSPTKLNTIFMGMVFDNLKSLTTDLSSILDSLGATSTTIQASIKNSIGKMTEFLKEIASALRGLKQQFYDMQIQEAEKRKELSIMQFGETQSKRLVEAAKLQATRRQTTKQRIAHAFTKILAPILAAVALLMTAVSAIATVVSGGALSGMLVACIALTVLAFSYSVADAATSGKVTAAVTAAMGKALEFLTKYLTIALTFGEEIPPQLQTAIKVFLMACVVAVVVAAMAASGNLGAGIQFSSAAASAAFSTMMAAAVSQIMIQLMTSVLMSPQGIPAVATEILMQHVKNPSARQKMIAQMVAMAIGMFVIIVSTMAGGKPNPGGIKEMSKSAMESVKTTIKDVAKTISEAAQYAYKVAKDAIIAFKNFVTSGDMLGIAARAALVTTARTLTAAGRMVLQNLEALKDLLKDFITYIPRAAMELKNSPTMVTFAKHINKTGTFLNLTGSIVNGVVLGVINLSLAKILKELGELDAAQETIKGLIKMMEKLMKSIDDFSSNTSSDISSISNMIKGLFRKASASMDKVADAVRPQGAG